MVVAQPLTDGAFRRCSRTLDGGELNPGVDGADIVGGPSRCPPSALCRGGHRSDKVRRGVIIRPGTRRHGLPIA